MYPRRMGRRDFFLSLGAVAAVSLTAQAAPVWKHVCIEYDKDFNVLKLAVNGEVLIDEPRWGTVYSRGGVTLQKPVRPTTSVCFWLKVTGEETLADFEYIAVEVAVEVYRAKKLLLVS